MPRRKPSRSDSDSDGDGNVNIPSEVEGIQRRMRLVLEEPRYRYRKCPASKP